MPPGYRGDILGYFLPLLTGAGWQTEAPSINRMAIEYKVWQLIAMHDWNEYMVEAYVDPAGVTPYFFITVYDG